MLLHRPFYFLRHGETEWNVDGRAQGQADIPLNETGVAQAKRAAEVVAGLGVATSFTGNFVAGYLGTYWEGMAKDQFFMMIAAIAAAASLAIFVVGRFLHLERDEG